MQGTQILEAVHRFMVQSSACTCRMAVLYVWHVVASVVIAAGMASGEGVTTMIDVGNGVSLPDRIAALTCAGLLNRPEALAAGVSIPAGGAGCARACVVSTYTRLRYSVRKC